MRLLHLLLLLVSTFSLSAQFLKIDTINEKFTFLYNERVKLGLEVGPKIISTDSLSETVYLSLSESPKEDTSPLEVEILGMFISFQRKPYKMLAAAILRNNVFYVVVRS